MGLLQQQPTQQQPNSQMVDMNQAQAQMSGTMDKLKRLVLAGQTILYDEKTSQGFLKYLDEQNIPQSVGEITAMVMAALIDKGREQATPPKLVIPAGAMIAADLLDYACKLFGVEMSDELAKATLTAFAEAMQRGVSQAQPAQQPQQPQQQFAQQGAM